MDAGILAQRDGLALWRMLAACDRLSKALNVPSISDELNAVTGDPPVKAMKQRELLATWMEQVAELTETRLNKPCGEAVASVSSVIPKSKGKS